MQALRNMKGRFFRVVSPFFAVCSLLLTGCSKEVANGGSEVDSGASGRLKVQTSVLTRSAVDGTVLPQGSAIGVVVTTSDGSAFFTPSATSGSGSADGDYYPDGKNVRFANETGVNMWTSTTADGKTKLLLFSDDERGKVYGYYPWTEDVDIEGEGALATVPVNILNEGTITVAADQTAAANHPAFTAKEEKDYMYSSRQDEVGAKTTTTARLVMEHVLARVSFRMYASSAAQLAVDGDKDSYYEFTGYTLRNRSGSEELIANYDRNTRMKVAGGDITGAVSGGEYVRRIEGYRLERSKGDTPDDDNSVADASLRVGNLCFPVRQISQDGGKSTGIEVVFEVRRMNGDGTVASGPAAYALPLAVVAGESDSWQAGKHYTYTVKFTGSSLSVESVTVTRWNEVPGGNMHIGEDPYVSSAAVTPSGDIPGGGDTYSITLNGLLSVHGTEVRARVDGQEEPLVEGKAFKSGEAVELEVPVNKTGDDRTVVFEYKLNGVWTKIEERRQIGYSISSATTNAPGSIPGPGGTYSVTLEGTLPPEGVEVCVRSGSTILKTGQATQSGQPVTLTIPANPSYDKSRAIVIEYKLNGEVTKVSEHTQAALQVGDMYGGGVVYWINSNNRNDLRVVALNEKSSTKWAYSQSYVLGSGAQDVSARNGADIWKIAKTYSDNKTGNALGNFAADFSAFSYCYEKTDGGVPKGTWYLPSVQELKDLYAVKGTVEAVITSNGGSAFSANYYRSATEYSSNSNYSWSVVFSNGSVDAKGKSYNYRVRCVRGK